MNAFDVVTNASDVANVLFDTSAYSKAWEISNKRTIGQAIAHGLLTADITDREQIRESEEALIRSNKIEVKCNVVQ